MNVIFRVDASIEVGSGHVMRCLTLAEQLQKIGYEINFICRETAGSMEDFIREKGYKVFLLPRVKDCLWTWTKEHWQQDAYETKQYLADKNIDLLIVDHYAIDMKWEQEMRGFTRKIMVIDDLANRRHNCDMLLDQNYYLDFQSRYHNLVDTHTVCWLGPSFVLLREEFFQSYEKSEVLTIFVFFGSMDQTNETEKTLVALKKLHTKYDFNVITVVGKSNLHKVKIENLCLELQNFSYYCQVDNMAELLGKCTFSISAGGTFTWERAILNVPGFIITVAQNQQELTEALKSKKATGFLGDCSNVTEEVISLAVENVLKNPFILEKWKENMNEVFDYKIAQERQLIKQIERVLSNC